MVVSVNAHKFFALVSDDKPSYDVIEFPYENFVSVTGVVPIGKTQDELAVALAAAFLRDKENGETLDTC